MASAETAQRRWDAANVKQLNLTLTRKSGMVEAMERMEKETGEKASAYAKRALKEQLEFDGWLQKS